MGLWSRRNRLARVPRRQFGTSSRTSRRASAHVSTVGLASRGQPWRSQRGVEEGHVEADVVADDDGAGDEVDERVEHGLDARRRQHHGLGDAGEHRDLRRDRRARVHEGVEGAEELAAAHPHGADLGDAARLRRRAGGLEVEHAEGGLGQRRAQVVERALHGRTIRRTYVREQEHVFGQVSAPWHAGTMRTWRSGTAAPRAATSPGSMSVTTRRTRAFHHYTTGGELTVEDEEVLGETVEAVTCRWCGPAGAVEVLADADGEVVR